MLPVLGKKAVLEWCMEEGLIGSSYVCPKCGKSMGKKERDVTNERGETKSKPKCVVDYNDQMGGADKVDQHLAPYFTSRKREENTNIFFHLLDLAL
ncbi:hypothetical protein TNCV_4024241 [Trichonephila clavipes]|uniref:PiggyBac transposable element-derived protein domain-containing protein n=1 Tax=Trichonephila clavipes TaxID=2585209 RepID=A0A8X6WDJ5_TRICX|nr:hypothetical protein TNCV_4024241 [Trichonephila clavipes]